MDEVKNFQISIDDCLRWIERLNAYRNGFEKKEDMDSARMMHLASVLMQKLAFDAECHAVNSPFPVIGGDC